MSDDLDSVLREGSQFAAQLFRSLASGSTDPRGGITRASYGDGEHYAHRLVADAACEMGLEVARDAACNTYMRWRAPAFDSAADNDGGRRGAGDDGGRKGDNDGNDDNRAIVIGSHLDSVSQGGNYDGAAGVVAGLTAVKMMQACGLRPSCDIIVMGIRAEESAWFQTSYIGSKAALGRLEPEALEARRIDTQRTLSEHISAAGGHPDKLLKHDAFLDAGQLAAYVEVHIEQAPSLVHAGNVLGVGTAIPGNFRYREIRVAGETAHVGLPRRFRRDSVMAATDFVSAMDDVWQGMEDAGTPMAVTVGRFHTDPETDAMTKVPGEVRFSIDVRAYSEADLAMLHQRMLDIIAQIESRRGVSFDLGQRTTAPVAVMDEDISRSFNAIARERGIAVQDLPSPASHDAAVFRAAGVPTALLLIRNENGSHNPHEKLELDDFMAAVEVLTRWIMQEHLAE